MVDAFGKPETSEIPQCCRPSLPLLKPQLSTADCLLFSVITRNYEVLVPKSNERVGKLRLAKVRAMERESLTCSDPFRRPAAINSVAALARGYWAVAIIHAENKAKKSQIPLKKTPENARFQGLFVPETPC